MECEEFNLSQTLPDWSPPDNPIQSERASSSIMECEELILPDWSPPDDPIQSERAKCRHVPNDDDDGGCPRHSNSDDDDKTRCLRDNNNDESMITRFVQVFISKEINNCIWTDPPKSVSL